MFGRYRLVFSWYFTNRYQRKTRLVHLGIVNLAGTSFSLKRGALVPFLMHPSPLFEEHRSSRQIVHKRSSRQISARQKTRVWSRKVSKGVMQEQEFLVSHPCKMRDSCKKWSLKSCKKYHCKTIWDLALAKSNRTKGGSMTPSKRGVEPALGVPATSYRNNTLFLLRTDSMNICTYTVLHFSRDQGCKTRPRSRKKSHVLISQGLAARPNSKKNGVSLLVCPWSHLVEW